MRNALSRAGLAATALATAALALPSVAAADEPCPNAKYRTGASLKLPDCRAYELVTPVEKYDQIQGWNTDSTGANPGPPGFVPRTGDRMAYAVATGKIAPDPSQGGLGNWERAVRTDTGWRVERMVAPPLNTFVSIGAVPQGTIFSEDVSLIAFSGAATFSPLQTPFGELPDRYGGVFLSDGDTNTWLSQPTAANPQPEQGSAQAGGTRWRVAGASTSLDRVYFIATGIQTPLDEASGRPPRSSWAAYKWHDGQLTNVGVLPDGSVSPGGSILADIAIQGDSNGGAVPPAPPVNGIEVRTHANAVSEDGKSALFVSPDPRRNANAPVLADPQPQLYLAREGQPSSLLSQPFDEDGPVGDGAVDDTQGVKRIGALGNSARTYDVYAMATADHSYVFFATPDALTEDAPDDEPGVTKTYRYSAEDGALTYIPEMDRPVGTAAPGLADANRGHIVAISPEGDSVLYIKADGEFRLWREGQSTRVIDPNMTNQSEATAQRHVLAVRFSSDGEKILIQTNAPLRGQANHTAPSVSLSQSQIYRYVPATDELECLTCRPGFANAQGASFTGGIGGAFGAGSINLGTGFPRRGVSPDLDMFVFQSDMRLTGDDHNDKHDVYRWKDGEISLISSGATNSANQMLFDMTEDGETIYILSRDRLVPWDVDNMYDVYAARVGGGFDPPSGVDQGVGCVGDECQGPVADSGGVAEPGSLLVKGAGNARAVRARMSVSARGGGKVARLAVRVSGPGTVRVSGSGVRTVAKRVGRAGAYRLMVRLDKAGVRRLARRGRVAASVRVVFRASSGKSVARRLTVRFKKKAGASGASAANRGGEVR